MRTVLWILFFLILFVGGGLLLESYPGEISLFWLGYRVETTVTVFVILTTILITLVLMIYKLLSVIFGIPTFFKKRYTKFANLRSIHAVEDSLVSLELGNAEKLLMAAHYIGEIEGDRLLQDYFLAKGHLIQGELEKAQAHFKVLLKDEAIKVLGYVGLAKIARVTGDIQTQIRMLEKVRDVDPSSSKINHSLIDLYIESEAFEKALSLIENNDHKISNPRMRRQTFFILTKLAKKKFDARDYKSTLRLLDRARNLRVLEKEDLNLYFQTLLSLGKEKKIAPLIEEIYGETQERFLIQLYLDHKNLKVATEQFQAVQRLLSFCKVSPETHLVSARYALNAKIWSKALEHLNALLDEGYQDPELYELLGTYELEAKNNVSGAAAWREKALKLLFQEHA